MTRKRLHFSKLYSFSCFKSLFTRDHSEIGQEGYSRLVYCNEPDSREALRFNYRVSTFFLLLLFSFNPLAACGAVSVLTPLLVVIGATMAKEAVEDWRRRKQDIEANNRKAKVYGKEFTFYETKWKKLQVGDVVKVCKDEYFPADLHLLSSSYDDGVCYVETMNLDGETKSRSMLIGDLQHPLK